MLHHPCAPRSLLPPPQSPPQWPPPPSPSPRPLPPLQLLPEPAWRQVIESARLLLCEALRPLQAKRQDAPPSHPAQAQRWKPRRGKVCPDGRARREREQSPAQAAPIPYN
eukprot:5242358-Pleurochrysis_carterae.AAC.2